MNKAFRSTCDRALQKLFEASPCVAAGAGSAAFLDRLDDPSPKGRRAAEDLVRDAAADLKRLESTSLGSAELADLRSLDNLIKVWVRDEKELKLTSRCAFGYVYALGTSLLSALELPELSTDDRATALLGRLGRLEGYLEAARRNLRAGYDVPGLWTELACASLDGLDAFFLDRLAPFAAEAGPQAERLGDAVEGSRRMLLRFRTFLAEELLPTCDGSFAVGRTHFDFLLDKRHGTHAKALEALEALEPQIEEAAAEAAEAAVQAGCDDLHQAMEAVCARPPALGRAARSYDKQLERALEFVRSRELATVPEDTAAEVEALPAFLAPVCADAMMACPPLDAQRPPRLWIREVDRNTEEPDRSELRGEHALALVQARAAAEGYPGALLMASYARGSAGRVRRLAAPASVTGGWALYACRVMADERFLKDPKARVAAARRLLTGAVAAELDIRLHLQLTGYDDAVCRLEETCALPAAAARALVNRLALFPAEAAAAWCGYRELLRLREGFAERQGEAFNQCELHDRILAQGPAPLAVLRSAVLG